MGTRAAVCGRWPAAPGTTGHRWHSLLLCEIHHGSDELCSSQHCFKYPEIRVKCSVAQVSGTVGIPGRAGSSVSGCDGGISSLPAPNALQKPQGSTGLNDTEKQDRSRSKSQQKEIPMLEKLSSLAGADRLVVGEGG